jgi:hypothetical protein
LVTLVTFFPDYSVKSAFLGKIHRREVVAHNKRFPYENHEKRRFLGENRSDHMLETIGHKATLLVKKTSQKQSGALWNLREAMHWENVTRTQTKT